MVTLFIFGKLLQIRNIEFVSLLAGMQRKFVPGVYDLKQQCNNELPPVFPMLSFTLSLCWEATFIKACPAGGSCWMKTHKIKGQRDAVGSTCKVEVVGMSPIKGPRGFLEQETLLVFLSVGWFTVKVDF